MQAVLETNVSLAKLGDREATAAVLEAIYSQVYRLALRMLCCPSDAQDAAQEILMRIVRNIGSFRGESAFTTWVYRVATNYLRTARKGRLESMDYTFERFGAELAEGLSDEMQSTDTSAEDELVFAEIRVGCTTAMLLCLDRDHRMSYVLGDILELDSNVAADVLGLRPAAFRKRLSRARAAVVQFMRGRCGLVNERSPCRCRKRAPHALKIGRVNREELVFVGEPVQAGQFPRVLRSIRQLEHGQRVVALQRLSSAAEKTPNPTIGTIVREVLAGVERTFEEDPNATHAEPSAVSHGF